MEELRKLHEALVQSGDTVLNEKYAPNLDLDADTSVNGDMKKLQNGMAEPDIGGVKQTLRANNDKWKNTVLHIAVTGSSGTGKSAFINALRGIEADDEGGAEVGVKETTADLTPYKHPKNPNFIVWDMPGVGSPKFPKETYLECVKFDQYDFFMIVSNGIYTEEDLLLAKHSQKQKKRFYFIRSKIDEDICSNKPGKHSTEKFLCTVRDNCYNNLIKAGIEFPKVFLVDNQNRESYDFVDLEAQLLEDFGSIMIETMTLSLSTLTKKSNLDRDACVRIDEEIKKLQNVIAEQGIEGVKHALRDNSDKWKNTVLHIAVTGSSGAGKSAFINGLRGIEAEDEGGAEVGVKETTANLTPYKHPKNPNFIVWDMPGVGTPEFPKERYLELVKFDQYDFFMIVSSSRFSEQDMWLAEQTQEQKKPFYFIRSKIDVDIDSDKRSNKKSHTPGKVLNTVRDDCYNNLIKAGIESPKVFLVDNLDRESYDFGQLEEQLLADSDSITMEAMALSLSTLTKEVLQMKIKILEGRIDGKAMEIACEMSFSRQQEIFEKEISYYKDQFNLDSKTLQDNRISLNLSEENVTEFQTFGQFRKELMIISFKENSFKWFIRLVRVMFGLGLCMSIPVFKYCSLCLQQNLDEMSKKALQMYGKEAHKGLVLSALTAGKNPITTYDENDPKQQ